MKQLVKTAFIGALFATGSLSAATYTITNGSGANATGIGDSTGNGFQGTEGVAALGIFSSTDFATFTATDFVTNFTAYGSPASTNFRTPGTFGNNGTFTFTPAGLAANATFVNKAMYVLVGNASTFGGSTEFLVLSLGRNFLAADDGVATPQTLTITSSTTLSFGSTIADLKTFGTDNTVNQGFLTAAPVPEPSVALLGALGALGLIRRRR